jgi:hypothetical protein
MLEKIEQEYQTLKSICLDIRNSNNALIRQMSMSGAGLQQNRVKVEACSDMYGGSMFNYDGGRNSNF